MHPCSITTDSYTTMNSGIITTDSFSQMNSSIVTSDSYSGIQTSSLRHNFIETTQLSMNGQTDNSNISTITSDICSAISTTSVDLHCTVSSISTTLCPSELPYDSFPTDPSDTQFDT